MSIVFTVLFAGTAVGLGRGSNLAIMSQAACFILPIVALLWLRVRKEMKARARKRFKHQSQKLLRGWTAHDFVAHAIQWKIRVRPKSVALPWYNPTTSSTNPDPGITAQVNMTETSTGTRSGVVPQQDHTRGIDLSTRGVIDPPHRSLENVVVNVEAPSAPVGQRSRNEANTNTRASTDNNNQDNNINNDHGPEEEGSEGTAGGLQSSSTSSQPISDIPNEVVTSRTISTSTIAPAATSLSRRPSIAATRRVVEDVYSVLRHSNTNPTSTPTPPSSSSPSLPPTSLPSPSPSPTPLPSSSEHPNTLQRQTSSLHPSISDDFSPPPSTPSKWEPLLDLLRDLHCCAFLFNEPRVWMIEISIREGVLDEYSFPVPTPAYCDYRLPGYDDVIAAAASPSPSSSTPPSSLSNNIQARFFSSPPPAYESDPENESDIGEEEEDGGNDDHHNNAHNRNHNHNHNHNNHNGQVEIHVGPTRSTVPTIVTTGTSSATVAAAAAAVRDLVTVLDASNPDTIATTTTTTTTAAAAARGRNTHFQQPVEMTAIIISSAPAHLNTYVMRPLGDIRTSTDTTTTTISSVLSND
ncbi:hypothetical protein BX616_004738, partial [Lobosporangium transversale]